MYKRQPYRLRLTINCLDAFVIELSGILRINKTKLHVRIVTNSDVKYLIYREALESVTTFDMEVDPVVYQHLDEAIKSAAQQENTRILCEKTLYTPEAEQFPTIVPVSVDTIEKSIVWAVQAVR